MSKSTWAWMGLGVPAAFAGGLLVGAIGMFLAMGLVELAGYLWGVS